MANNGEFVEVVSSEAIKKVKEIVALINEGADGVARLNSEFSKVKTPSGNKNVLAGVNNEMQKSIFLIERQRLAQIKLDKDREKAFDKYEANLKKEESIISRNQNAYNRLQVAINRTSQEYNNLAVLKGINGKLTEQEERRLGDLTNRLNRYQGVLKSVDANIGRYTRSVGNYASGWNGLSNSINQLTREAPAFAVSLNTGFLALSNNLPILFDEIQRTKDGIAALKSEGKTAPSLFSSIASSVFSFQTLLSVGVTLLTLYGGAIFDWIGSLNQADQALGRITESQLRYNEATTTGRKNFATDLGTITRLTQAVQNNDLSLEKRNIAYDKLMKLYPAYFKESQRLLVQNGTFTKSQYDLMAALDKRTQAEAKLNANNQTQARIIDIEDEIQARNKYESALQREQKALSAINQTKGVGGSLVEARDEVKASIERIKANEELRKERRDSNDEEKKLASGTIALQKELNQLYKENGKSVREINKLYGESLLLDKELDKESKKKIKREKEEIALEGIKSKEIDSLISSMENEIKFREKIRDSLSRNGEEYRELDKRVQALKLSLQSVVDLQGALGKSGDIVAEKLKKQGEETKKAEENMIKLEESTRLFINSIGSSYFSDLGFSSLNFFTEVQENGLTAFQTLMAGADTLGEKIAITLKGVGDIAKDVFAFMNQNQQAYYDAQYERLKKEKDLALEFAGESATGKAEIERQYEERRKEIDRRKAKAQKDTAIFNAIVNTAQAVTAFLAEANYAGAILAGVLGAAQIAIISNTQVPQYALGTDNHAGGLAVVGDGGKHEVVYQPSKGFSLTPKNDTLVDLEKGSKVYPDFNSFLKNSGALLGGVPNIQLENSGASASDIDSIMGKYFSNITTQHTTIDKNGLNSFINTRNNKMKVLNNRVSGKGFSV